MQEEKTRLVFTSNRDNIEEGYQIVENDGNVQSIHPFGKRYLKLEDVFSNFMLLCAQDKTVLEIGHHMGYFSFLSILAGATSVGSYSTMNNYVDFIEDVFTNRFGSRKTQINVGSTESILNTEKADIVVATNLVHWLYHCSDHHHGSLSRAIGLVAKKVKKFLIIEWVQPTDPTSPEFRYLRKLSDNYAKQYNNNTEMLHMGAKMYLHEIFQLALIKIFELVKGFYKAKLLVM